VGGTTLHSIGEIADHLRVKDNEKEYVAPNDMLRGLMADNKTMMVHMRAAHKLCDEHNDVATASLLETFIDCAERRNWFLFETSRKADPTGH
jgi:starvation-inducible DNA-binding protein